MFTGHVVVYVGEMYDGPDESEKVVAIELEDLCADTMPAMEAAWRRRLRSLAESVQESTCRFLAASERKMLASLGASRSDVISETHWGIRILCRAFAVQYGQYVLWLRHYDAPILEGILRGFGRAASELMEAIIDSCMTSQSASILLTCRVPLALGRRFQGVRNSIQYSRYHGQPGKREYEWLCTYADSDFLETARLLIALLQRDYLEWSGRRYINCDIQGIRSREEFLSALLVLGCVEESAVGGRYYLRADDPKPLYRIGQGILDRYTGRHQYAISLWNAIRSQDRTKLEELLQPYDLSYIQVFLGLSLLMQEEASYRIYAVIHERQQWMTLIGAAESPGAITYAIHIVKTNMQDWGTAYMKLRQYVKKESLYRWIQIDMNVLELNLVLFTNTEGYATIE